MTYLFAIDEKTAEVLVSQSADGSNQIKLIERIRSNDNEVLYYAVKTLTSITRAPNPDYVIFDLMDKLCQRIYNHHKGIV